MIALLACATCHLAPQPCETVVITLESVAAYSLEVYEDDEPERRTFGPPLEFFDLDAEDDD